MISPYIFAGLPERVRKKISLRTSEDVVVHVCSKLGIKPVSFFGNSRSQAIVDARMIACRMLRNMGYSFEYAGSIVRKNKATVYHYCDKFDAHYKIYDDFKQKADLCIK